MRRKGKHKRRSARAVPLDQNQKLERSRLQIVLEFAWALLFFVLLVLAKEHFVDHSIVGEHVRQSAYDISQVWLASVRDTRPLSIVVVDIGTLQPCPERLPNGTILYPRQALKDAVTAVLNQHPTAVAIDVDFSLGTGIRCSPLDAEELARDKEQASDQKQFSDRGGPPFFDFCLDQQQPIFLGIFRTQYESPDEWLGSADYARLAASITLPDESTEENMSKEPDGIRRSMTRQIVHENQYALDSLSYALSKHKPRQLSWSQRLLERLPGGTFPIIQNKEVGPGISVDRFLVDFSSLKPLQETTATYRDGKLSVNGVELTDKLVLMGYTDTAESADKFIAPGDVKQVAGIYWHASAVDTLLRGLLVQPTKKGEFLLDALFYVPIVLLIFGLRIAYAGRPNVHIAQHRIESIGTKIAALLIFLIGTYFVSTTRLMWDGFLLVAVITALHPTIEVYCKSAAQWLWSKGNRLMPNLFSRGPGRNT